MCQFGKSTHAADPLTGLGTHPKFDLFRNQIDGSVAKPGYIRHLGTNPPPGIGNAILNVKENNRTLQLCLLLIFGKGVYRTEYTCTKLGHRRCFQSRIAHIKLDLTVQTCHDLCNGVTAALQINERVNPAAKVTKGGIR